MIFEYEIPKFDGDSRSPNLFVELHDKIINKKINHILELFVSQNNKQWFRRETFHGLAGLRGIEGSVASGYAEGFY